MMIDPKGVEMVHYEGIPLYASRDHNAYDDYGMVYRELRALAYELRLPIWTASQTNKDALNKEFVDWNAVADSSKKVMVADAVVILLQTLAEKKQKSARLFFAKNRFGGDKFDVKVRLDWSRSTIRRN
jgi:replicative DNA helicase